MDLLLGALLAMTRPTAEGTAIATPVAAVQTVDETTAEEPEMTAEELAREKILARWKERQAALAAALPTESFTANVSAYTAAADECGKSDGITASGVKVAVSRTLACPPQYPFGTKVTIDGMGTYVCEDRGGAIKENRFDIYMETKGEAFAFGRRMLTATVLN